MNNEEREGIMSQSQVSVSISDNDDVESGNSSSSSNTGRNQSSSQGFAKSHQASPNKFSINDDEEEGDDLGDVDVPAAVFPGKGLNASQIRKNNSTDL